MKKSIFSLAVAAGIIFLAGCKNWEELKKQQDERIEKTVVTKIDSIRAAVETACNSRIESAVKAHDEALAAAALLPETKPTVAAKPATKPTAKPAPTPAPKPVEAKPAPTNPKTDKMGGDSKPKTPEVIKEEKKKKMGGGK